MTETEHRLLPSGLKVREAREYDVDALARLMGGQNAYHADLVPISSRPSLSRGLGHGARRNWPIPQ